VLPDRLYGAGGLTSTVAGGRASAAAGHGNRHRGASWRWGLRRKEVQGESGMQWGRGPTPARPPAASRPLCLPRRRGHGRERREEGEKGAGPTYHREEKKEGCR
jgi:hypothetical protein